MMTFGPSGAAPRNGDFEDDDPGDLEYELTSAEGSGTALRTITWSAIAVAVAALGLYIGRELRVRYKFERRTPYDFFSKAGARPAADYAGTEYGMGI